MRKQLKIWLVGIAIGLVTLHTQAQNPSDTLKMSLEQCVEYALKNSVSVKNATLDEEIASARVRQIRGIGLPQINGSAGLQHYFKLRNAYLPGNSPFAALPAGTPTQDILVLPAIFQLPTNIDASINASQILFSSSYIVGLQAAKTFKELSFRAAQQTKETTANNVKKAYYQNLINVERIKLFDVNIVRLDSSLKQLKALQKNGFVEQIEVDRLEVSLNNILTEYEKTINLLALSSLSLKFQMGMPIETNILLTDSIGKFANNANYKMEETVEIKNRPEYQLLKLQVKSYQLDLKNNKGSSLPTVLLSGSLGAFTSSKDLNFFDNKNIVVFKDLSGTPPEFKNQSIYWSSYSFVQLGLSVPIFTGFQKSNLVQQSRLNLSKAQNNLSSFEQAANVELQASKVNLMNSQRSMEIQKRNMELAKNVSINSYKKYKAGTGSNLELINSESSLKEAQINYFNALFDFLVYKIDYEKAAGLNKY